MISAVLIYGKQRTLLSLCVLMLAVLRFFEGGVAWRRHVDGRRLQHVISLGARVFSS